MGEGELFHQRSVHVHVHVGPQVGPRQVEHTLPLHGGGEELQLDSAPPLPLLQALQLLDRRWVEQGEPVSGQAQQEAAFLGVQQEAAFLGVQQLGLRVFSSRPGWTFSL